MMNKTAFAIMTLAPIGVSKAIDIVSPAAKQRSEITPEATTTLLKVPKSFIAVSDGKMMSPDMRRVPMIFMPTTIVRAVRSAIALL